MMWWMSFCDSARPAGSRFLGVIIVEAPDSHQALVRTHALGVNPGGELLCGSTPILPAAEYLDRLLTKEEATLAEASLGVADA